MKSNLSLITVIIALTIFVSCKNDKKEAIQETQTTHVEEHAPKKECKDVHWSHHEGHGGPEGWVNLCDGFAACGGSAQSPINIVSTEAEPKNKLVAPKFSYTNSGVDIINNGHTVQFNVNGENTVILDDKDYTLLQFHYHALSEHTVDGNHFPIEVHFVHQHSDTDFAVLGMLFEEGAENELFSNFLTHFPKEKGAFKSEAIIDLLGLFPEDKSYYNYNGSLTTPPCSEVVNWYVLKTPLTASKEQIAAFSTILHDNYRPIQALNDRSVMMYQE